MDTSARATRLLDRIWPRYAVTLHMAGVVNKKVEPRAGATVRALSRVRAERKAWRRMEAIAGLPFHPAKITSQKWRENGAER